MTFTPVDSKEPNRLTQSIQIPGDKTLVLSRCFHASGASPFSLEVCLPSYCPPFSAYLMLFSI